MQIIWDQEAVEKLKSSHTVLELETFQVNEQALTAYCLIPPDKVLSELPELDNIKALHSRLIRALTDKDYPTCKEVLPHLMGKFDGELDSFYQEVLTRTAQ